MEFIPNKAEINQRLDSLREFLTDQGLDCAIIAQHTDLFYFAGSTQDGYLVIPVDGNPIYFVRKYFPRARNESYIEDIRPAGHGRSTFSEIRKILETFDCTRIGLEMDVIPAVLFQRFVANFGSMSFHDISPGIRRIRMIKSDMEIALITHSASLLDQLFDRIPSFLSIGMAEFELAAILEKEMRLLGHQGHISMRTYNGWVHYGNILFGKSGAVRGYHNGPTCGPGLYPSVPKGAGNRKLEPDTPVFIDLVFGYGGYLADATRLFYIGNLPDTLSMAHTACIEIQDRVIQQVVTGRTGSEIYRSALEMADQIGIREYFMGPMDDQAPFIAHGVGLEIDELPLIANRFDLPLPNNAVFALEPKAIFPDLGAVGIENTWILSSGVARRLLTFPDEAVRVDT